jgi:serine protease inhibitor ecotin
VKTPITALISIAVLAACIPCTAAAQNQRQLEQKYPKVNAYVVRPNILLTAQYASDGQVCEMQSPVVDSDNDS